MASEEVESFLRYAQDRIDVPPEDVLQELINQTRAEIGGRRLSWHALVAQKIKEGKVS